MITPEQDNKIFEALGRIEQKLDDHLKSHASSNTWVRWSITSIVAVVTIWATAAFARIGGL
jgi:hypothetical protein